MTGAVVYSRKKKNKRISITGEAEGEQENFCKPLQESDTNHINKNGPMRDKDSGRFAKGHSRSWVNKSGQIGSDKWKDINRKNKSDKDDVEFDSVEINRYYQSSLILMRGIR